MSPPPLSLPLRVRSSSRSSTVPSRAWSNTRSNQRSMSDVALVSVVISSAARLRPPLLDPPSSAGGPPWCRRVSVLNLAPAGMSGICDSTTAHTITTGYRLAFTALQLCRRGLPMSICLSVCLSVKRVDCDKTKAPSEKSSIITNRKSTTSFPMSLR